MAAHKLLLVAGLLVALSVPAMAAKSKCTTARPVCGPPPTAAPQTAAKQSAPPPELSPEQQQAVFARLREALRSPPSFSGTEGAVAERAASSHEASAAALPEFGSPTAANRPEAGVSRASRLLDSILGVLSVKYGVVRPVNNITRPNDEGQAQGELIQMLSYLENPDGLKVGVDVVRGGVVGHISSRRMPEPFRGRSLINTYDCGRMLQQSYYGCNDGSCWSKRPWRWNPVQCGSWENLPARLTDARITDKAIKTTAMPRNWGNQELLEDVLLSSEYRLLPDALSIDFSMLYQGESDQPVNTQEVPAFFADRRLSVMALYDGDEPWTNGSLKFVMPGGVNEDYRPTERWAAYIEPETGYGIGVFTPIASGMTSYRVGKDGSQRASDVSYFALTARFPIGRNSTFKYRAYTTIGRVDEIRETFQKYAIAEGLVKQIKAQQVDASSESPATASMAAVPNDPLQAAASAATAAANAVRDFVGAAPKLLNPAAVATTLLKNFIPSVTIDAPSLHWQVATETGRRSPDIIIIGGAGAGGNRAGVSGSGGFSLKLGGATRRLLSWLGA